MEFTHMDIIKHCNGTLKLGIKFDGFNQPGETFFFPFGIGEKTKFNTSSINMIMRTEKIPDNLMEYPDLATHFRTTEMLEYLDTLAPGIKNLHIHRKEVGPGDLDGTYDLLIDCTGFNSKLSYIPDNFENIIDTIPNNCALTIRVPYTDTKKQRKPYSTFKAMTYGWMWNIPLGDQLAMGYVHSDKYDVMGEFVDYVKETMGVTITPEQVYKVKFNTGRCKKHLTGNVARLGLASAFIEPLESTGIYLITAGIDKIRAYIDGEINEQEYNDKVNENFDAIVNFIVAHYKYSKRDNEYWNHFKSLPCDRYKTQEIFPTEAWDYILSGFETGAVAPKEDVDPTELIRIHRGTDYQDWLDNARNAP